MFNLHDKGFHTTADDEECNVQVPLHQSIKYFSTIITIGKYNTIITTMKNNIENETKMKMKEMFVKHCFM